MKVVGKVIYLIIGRWAFIVQTNEEAKHMN